MWPRMYERVQQATELELGTPRFSLPVKKSTRLERGNIYGALWGRESCEVRARLYDVHDHL